MPVTRLISVARRFKREQRGLAMTEFALSLPILLTVVLFGLELANLAISHLRVSQIAMLTADSAARVRLAIDEADVNDILVGSAMVGERIDFDDNGRIILSSLEPNSVGTGQYIRWQRCFGKKVKNSSWGTEGDGETDASVQYMGPASNQIYAADGTTTMVVEVFYDYQPLIDGVLPSRELHYMQAFTVRDRTNQALQNNNSATPSDCSTYSGL